jgi:hypothetical protein
MKNKKYYGEVRRESSRRRKFRRMKRTNVRCNERGMQRNTEIDLLNSL